MTREAFESLHLPPLDKFMDSCQDRLGFVLRRGDLHEVIHQIPGQGDRRPFHETIRHTKINKLYDFNSHIAREKLCAKEKHRKFVNPLPGVFLLESRGHFGYPGKKSPKQKARGKGGQA